MTNIFNIYLYYSWWFHIRNMYWAIKLSLVWCHYLTFHFNTWNASTK